MSGAVGENFDDYAKRRESKMRRQLDNWNTVKYERLKVALCASLNYAVGC